MNRDFQATESTAMMDCPVGQSDGVIRHVIEVIEGKFSFTCRKLYKLGIFQQIHFGLELSKVRREASWMQFNIFKRSIESIPENNC